MSSPSTPAKTGDNAPVLGGVSILDQIRDATFVEVHRGSKHLVQRVLCTDGTVLIFKRQTRDGPSMNRRDPLPAEYTTLQRLAAAGVAQVSRPVALLEHETDSVLVLQDAGPLTFEAWLKHRPLPVDHFLHAAIQLAEILSGIHGHRVIHRDISPTNVVVSAEGSRLTLIDFGHARVWSQEIGGGGVVDRRDTGLTGALNYVAPEQTGQLDWRPDHRADLYSLGATLYEALAGAPPFCFDNPAELIHAHLALTPAPPTARNPAAPEVLSAIVLRLLAKMPEERYQSADELLVDLRESQRQWRGTRVIAPFALGRMAAAPIPPAGRLYGRTREHAELDAAVERARAGACELVLIPGPGGIGKSSLVESVHREQAERWDGNVQFLSGKCEARGANMPYAPFVQALRGFFAELVRRPGVDLARWRAHLEASIGSSVNVVAGLIPELEAVLCIGDLPAVATTGARASEARSRMAFELTIDALADWAGALGQPLIIHLDDLQWADGDSLALIEHLVRAFGGHHVLLLAGYRPDELTERHPIRQLLAATGEFAFARKQLPLGPLDLDALVELSAEACASPAPRVLPLAELVLRKTAGNPFFALRFVQHLQGNGDLRFDARDGSWHWDLADLEATTVTDNVADLLIAALANQPAATRAVLEPAACLRGPIGLSLLAAVVGQPEAETARSLWPALRDGLVVPLAERHAPGNQQLDPAAPHYRFAHDRIQAAAYSLLSEAARPRLHLAVGRELRRRYGERDVAGLDQRLFDVVDQLNLGVELMDEAQERAALGDLNRRAAERARLSGGLVPALLYARHAIALLPAEAWQTRHAETLALHRLAIECGFFTGDTAVGEALFAAALAQVAATVEKAELYGLRASIESACANQAGALALGRAGLQLLEIDLDSPASLSDELNSVRRMLANMRGTALIDLPAMKDATTLTSVGLLLRMSIPARLTDAPLWARIVTRIAHLSLQHGNAAASAYGYVGVGVLLAELPDDGGAGEALAQAGVDLARAQRAGQTEALTLTTYVVMSNRWHAPLRSYLPLLARAAAAAVESGEFTAAGYALATSMAQMFHCGLELVRVQAACAAGARMMRRTGRNPLLRTPLLYREAIRRLQGAPASGGREAATDTDTDTDTGAEFEAAPHPHRLLAPVVLRDGAELAARLPGTADFVRSDDAIRLSFAGPWVSLYIGLAAAQLIDQAAPDRGVQFRQLLADSQRTLAGYGALSPGNFQHRADLVAAEAARLDGQTLEAFRLYDQAIVGAQRAQVVHEEALARELAGRCRLGSPLEDTALAYLSSAREGYARWGALAKVAALDAEFPELLNPAVSPGMRKRGGSTDETDAPALDLHSLLKAAESISSEVDLDRLLERLIGVCLELAGARRGVLVLDEREGLAVRAVGTVSDPVDLERTALGAADRLPQTLVEHVFHSHETVALADATRSVRFGADPYIARNQVKSVLAVPILRQARAIGVCYLENDLSSYGFSDKRVRMLTLLTSQIASALENSRLFGDLRVEIKERQRAERAVRFLAEASAALAQSLDYHTTLAELAQLVVPFLADWCTVDVLEPDGRIAAVAAAHRDPVKQALLQQLRREFPVVDAENFPSYHAIHGQATVVSADLSEARSAESLTNPRHLALVQEIGMHSAATVPLVARGRALGAIMLVSATMARRYGAAELALAEELARRAAIAIDNARLYQEAQEAIRRREEFLIAASHELNTPIASLRLVAQSLAPGADPPSLDEIARILGVVDRQSARLAALVSEMLDVTRGRSGGVPTRRELLDLGAVVEQAVDQLRDRIRSARCALSLQIESGVLGRLDRAAIGRIVVNLLSNAIKFGARKPIEVSVRRQAEHGCIVVADHGIGLDPARLPRIFQRFERGVPSESYGGLGLGLHIVHDLVSSLGGSIDVLSRPGQGATFTVSLPLHPDEPPELPAPRSQKPAVAGQAIGAR